MRHSMLPCATLWRWIGSVCWLAATAAATAATLTNGAVHPKNGDLSTVFKFNVTYQDPVLTNLPLAVQLILDEATTNTMSAADASDFDPRDGKVYVWAGTLPKARHRFRFATVPASGGDILRHVGPDVSDAPLLVRQFYFFLNCPADYFAGGTMPKLDGSYFGCVGDLNGDGFSDLAYTWDTAPIHGQTNEGAAMIYYGPDYARCDTLLHPRYPAHALFGDSVAGGGDLDGDGFGDLVIGSAGTPPRLFVYHGRASGPPVLVDEIVTTRVETAKALLDVNGDGLADLASLEFVDVPALDRETTRLKVRYGPNLETGISSALGAAGDEAFGGLLSITDRNGDCFPDFVFDGALYKSYTNHPLCFLSADSPDLSLWVSPKSGSLPRLMGIGDMNGDGRGDFGSNDTDWRRVDWYSGPDMILRGSVSAPLDSGYTPLGFFGAGDGTGTGRSSLAYACENGTNARLSEIRYYWGTAADPLASHVFLTEWLVSDSWIDFSWGPARDTDGNGLEDFFVAAPDSTHGPGGFLTANTLGTVLVGSPCYPYPLSEGDLPARFRARMNACRLDLEGMSPHELSPNGSLEFVAGTADSNHLAPLIILADTLWVPDKLLGGTSEEPIVLRVRAAGEDGSGYIYADGPFKGQGQLQLWVMVELVQLGAPEVIRFSDTLLAKVDLDPPLNLATGYGKLVCRGVLAEFLAAAGLPDIESTLTMAGYVDYVRPTETPFLMRVPARADFGGVCVGSNTTPQRITLCNLGETSLRITGLTLPGAPFRITGAPSLPATINPASALVLTAEYLPTAAGHHEAAITVTSDEPAHPTTTVWLSGSAIAPGEKDTDGDGLPDSFELRYAKPTDTKFSGLSTNLLDGHLDNDRDGTSNLNEYFAGTDPTNPKSVFKLVSARRTSATSLQLSWLSVTGRTYSVCRSTNLISGYSPIQTGITGNGTTNTFTDTTATSHQSAFYRIRLE